MGIFHSEAKDSSLARREYVSSLYIAIVNVIRRQVAIIATPGIQIANFQTTGLGPLHGRTITTF